MFLTSKRGKDILSAVAHFYAARFEGEQHLQLEYFEEDPNDDYPSFSLACRPRA